MSREKTSWQIFARPWQIIASSSPGLSPLQGSGFRKASFISGQRLIVV
jgi:hypothetical protein